LLVQRVQIAFTGTAEYRQRLQEAALARQVKVQELIEQAVDALLADSRPPAKKPSPKEAEAHRLLQVIMDEGTAQEVEWITGNLKTFVLAIQSRPQPKTSRKAG
jgi:hypothetical protein